MNLMKKSLFFLLLSSSSILCSADVAVIVSSNNGNSNISASDISKVFLGKSKSFPDGSQAIAVDQNDDSATRKTFNDKVLGKSSSQLKSYWSRLIFTGKGTPPKQLVNDAAVKAAVAGNPGMIGYIDASSVDGTVKVVGKF